MTTFSFHITCTAMTIMFLITCTRPRGWRTICSRNSPVKISLICGIHTFQVFLLGHWHCWSCKCNWVNSFEAYNLKTTCFKDSNKAIICFFSPFSSLVHTTGQAIIIRRGRGCQEVKVYLFKKFYYANSYLFLFHFSINHNHFLAWKDSSEVYILVPLRYMYYTKCLPSSYNFKDITHIWKEC